MSYEPRGKMIDLIMAKVRAQPQRIFTMKEVCEVLCCKTFRSTVDQYIYAASAAGLFFKREVDGTMYYAGVAISDALLRQAGIEVKPRGGQGLIVATGARTSEEAARAAANPRAPGPSGFIPTPMVAPRAGSDAKAPKFADGAPAPTPAPTAAPAATPAPTPAPRPIQTRPPEPAPAKADASIPEGVAAVVDEDEPREFDASLWLDGDLVIYGAAETEDGGILITKEQLARVKRLIAWSSA